MEHRLDQYRVIYDSHAHYDDPAFDCDRGSLLRQELPLSGLRCVINMGTNFRTSATAVGFAESFPHFFAGVGIHPEEVDEEHGPEKVKLLRVWLDHGDAVCVGEIGLDYHWPDAAPRKLQMEVFAAQLALANEYGLPVSVHDRDAHGDVLDLLRQYRPEGVVHCFSGSVEMAREIIDLGMYIGVGGAVTFKNARKLPDVVREIPLDRLLLETDAPYLAPEPFRGKRNLSSYIPYIAERVGEIRGMPLDEVLKASNENIARLFRLEGRIRPPAVPETRL